MLCLPNEFFKKLFNLLIYCYLSIKSLKIGIFIYTYTSAKNKKFIKNNRNKAFL